MAKGIFIAQKNNGEYYYRASINRKNKKISLGSFSTEDAALRAYKEAVLIFDEKNINLENYSTFIKTLSDGKAISLLNLRDNGIYFKTPIYLRGSYFSYFLPNFGELKFDNEDLFYYSSHTIMKRGGHFFINDYGSQYSLISRYGIRAYGVEGKDYRFVNNDPSDFRYENILIINKYRGVTRKTTSKGYIYIVKIHINGEYNLGRFKDEISAAICYNKGIDIAIDNGIKKEFTKNYIEEIDAERYKSIYKEINLPKKYINYINSFNEA